MKLPRFSEANVELSSYVIMAIGLWIIFVKGLLAAVLSGFLVYAIIHSLTPLLARTVRSDRARLVAVAAIGLTVVTALTIVIWGGVTYFRGDSGSVQRLLQKLADILEASRDQMPEWLRDIVPLNAVALNRLITEWLRTHATEAKTWGEEAGRFLAHILIGGLIGIMASMHDTSEQPKGILASAIEQRLIGFYRAFRSVVFAQVRISLINTLALAAFVFLLLPALGIHLPLRKSLIAITFLVGLLPVVGNLISNSMLVIVGLSQSLQTAILSLLFLVVIHKLEYFLNAKIVGSHINAKVWEVLSAMLLMEAVFGVAGLVAAPILYAYIKDELRDFQLI